MIEVPIDKPGPETNKWEDVSQAFRRHVGSSSPSREYKVTGSLEQAEKIQKRETTMRGQHKAF